MLDGGHSALGEGAGEGVDFVVDRIGVPTPAHFPPSVVLGSDEVIGELAPGRASPGHMSGKMAGMEADSLVQVVAVVIGLEGMGGGPRPFPIGVTTNAAGVVSGMAGLAALSLRAPCVLRGTASGSPLAHRIDCCPDCPTCSLLAGGSLYETQSGGS